MCAGSGGFFGLSEDGRISLLYHLFAEVHPHEVVLKNIVIEHVLGGLAEINDPFAERRWADTEGHILRVGRTGSVVVATDSADAAGDEMGVARVLAFHEDAVAAKDRRGAMTFRDLAIFKINFGEDAQAADDASDRVPIHFH